MTDPQQWYIFDGEWLTTAKENGRTIEREQIVRPGEKSDLFKLGCWFHATRIAFQVARRYLIGLMFLSTTTSSGRQTRKYKIVKFNATHDWPSASTAESSNQTC